MADNDFRIKSESPANDDLMFWCIVGHESFSRPSGYELRVLSKNEAIDPKKVLGHAFDVEMTFKDADGGTHQRHAQGHAVRFVRAAPIGRYFQYHITLRSWFWLLTKRTNSRIFQDKTVLEVLDAVLEDSPLKRFKSTKPDNVIGVHRKRRYCVQHQESDYQFLSRLFEDEGIYYWFGGHDAPDAMHLSDTSAVAHGVLPADDTLRAWQGTTSEPRYTELEYFTGMQAAHSGKYASRDSDFKAIKVKLSGDKSDPDTHELADLEVFEFPGGYFNEDDRGEVAKVRMEELAARRQLFHGKTRWADVAPGWSFHYKGDGRGPADGDYLIASCAFYACHGGYEGMPPNSHSLDEQDELRKVLKVLSQGDPVNAGQSDLMDELINDAVSVPSPRGTSSYVITALPADVPYRPQRLTQRATMPGPQTAIVVGPAGEEIHADDFGRVKVQFHWDRYGEENEDSTCWVRVSQPWAGKGWGGYFAPRIGQEVIVDFLNGDPDRPVIVGRVYDDDQPIPFETHTQSGFRTRSTPKGNANNFNEFRFEDKKGSEQVYLHAEKNQDIEVEADETHWVGHDRKKTIDNDENVEVKNNRTEKVGVDETIDIGSNRTETVGADESITIGANRTETVGANETVNIGANRDHTVAANETRTVGANETTTVGGARVDSVGASMTQSIGATLTQNIGAALNVTSAGAMTFTAAGGFNIIAPGGTKIVDFELMQVGGTIKEGYAMKLDVNGIVTELNGVKVEVTGATTAAILLKAETIGAEASSAMTVQQMAGLEALSSATGIEMDALKVFL
ncbi:MAG: type VI secretion system tip protein VgrG [Variovorax sp.]|nr:MAG: type VI secretion system tip protein VgrG [Variovorax sp.]